MDQNPIDDSPRNVHDLSPIYFGPLHDESEVSEEELRQPTLGNNWNIERFQGRYHMILTLYLIIIF